MSFTLHRQLAKDCLVVGDLPLCRVLLMNDRRFPWLILVPRRKGLREVFDLSPKDYKMVMKEMRRTAKKFAALTKAEKMNIAALGNVVPQLHIHVIARFKDDAAWPNPVWSARLKPVPYAPAAQAAAVKKVKKTLGL